MRSLKVLSVNRLEFIDYWSGGDNGNAVVFVDSFHKRFMFGTNNCFRVMDIVM